MSEHDGIAVLNVPMDDADSGAKSIKQYLKLLLERVWQEEESFSGKRPFGNSGWSYDLYKPLVIAGMVEGEIIDGFLEILSDESKREADLLIFDVIDAL